MGKPKQHPPKTTFSQTLTMLEYPNHSLLIHSCNDVKPVNAQQSHTFTILFVNKMSIIYLPNIPLEWCTPSKLVHFSHLARILFDSACTSSVCDVKYFLGHSQSTNFSAYNNENKTDVINGFK